MSLRVLNLRFRVIGRTVRPYRRLIFLATGGLAFVAGIALPNLVLCICGMIIAGSFAWDTAWGSPESAHVRMWQRADKTSARRR
jgi:hypothetical protein